MGSRSHREIAYIHTRAHTHTHTNTAPLVDAGKYFLGPKLTFHYEFSPIPVQGYFEKIVGRAGEGRSLDETQVLDDIRIIDVACGQSHTVAINHDGNVFTWGFGGFGRLGHNCTDDEHRVSVKHVRPAGKRGSLAARLCAVKQPVSVSIQTTKQRSCCLR